MPIAPPPPITGFDPARYPRKLNLGCGRDKRAGYINIDLWARLEPDVVADVRHLDALPAYHYDEILALDVLEHLPRTDTKRTLAHWNRLLSIGGTLRVRVPSVLALADMLREPENQTLERQERLIWSLFGTQAQTGDFHFTTFTEVTLREYLRLCGFSVQWLSMHQGWMFDATATKVAHVTERDVDPYWQLVAIKSDAEFVRECYRQLLLREPDEGGFNYFLSCITSGEVTREVVIGWIVDSDERKQLVAAGRLPA